MKIQRLFNLTMAMALMAAVLLTVREAAATADVLSQAGSPSRSGVRCDDLPTRDSIRTEYVSERGAWVIVSEDGPTGLDGGLVQLMSDYRTCSH